MNFLFNYFVYIIVDFLFIIEDDRVVIRSVFLQNMLFIKAISVNQNKKQPKYFLSLLTNSNNLLETINGPEY